MLFRLRDCDDDVGGHLVNCHLCTESLTEMDLILARAGLFSVTESQIEVMSMCARHRHSLGKFWQPPRPCQYPDHKGKSTAGRKACHRFKTGKGNPQFVW